MSTENPLSKRPSKRTELLEKAKTLATSPGVYLMKHDSGQVLYVGKAKSLRSRVSSYFQPVTHEHPRTELLLQNVVNFEVIHTETENEALVLECTLIKRYKPKYNVRLKDDKTYPYIMIRTDIDFPRLEWTRKTNFKNARYFGPFPSAYSARTVLRLLTESYRLRDCSDNTFAHRSRACILYQMDQCSAPCVGKILKDDYQHYISEAISILEGKSTDLVDRLKKQMDEAAEEERYEDAARIRDQMQSVQLVSQTQSVLDADSKLDQDVFAFERADATAHGVVLQVRGGKLIAVKHYNIQNFDGSLTDRELLYDFLTQHSLLITGSAEIMHAKEVLMKEAPADRELLESTLGIQIRTPETDAQKQLVNVAQTNAKFALSDQKHEKSGHGVGALEEIQSKLDLERLPRRIECYDISNFQGDESVASRVVFIDGAPDKKLYRRYKIKTVIGANDFASMREIFERRFSKMDLQAGDERPDLVVVDGGKGQLGQAKAIFDELNIQGVDLVGLAKARTERNFQAKEVESSNERIFIPGRVNPIPLYNTTRAYKLLTHIRDEAHRFAITFHRLRRDKKSMKGSAD
jgi:excinuclease ABC subunit C